MIISEVFIGLIMLFVFYLLYCGFVSLYYYLTSKKISAPGPIFGTGCVQEDPENAATRKRVRKAFEEQQQELNARAMKAHDPTCPDTWECKKEQCFVWEPNKIVGKPEIVKRKTDDERREEERERQSMRDISKKPDKPFKRRRTKE